MAENKAAPHSFVKDGVYYFIRRVPNDLRHHYTSPKISYSLRTRSVTVAASRAVRAAQKLDEYWYHLRISDSDLPGKHLLRMAGNGGFASSAPPMASTAAVTASVKLSEAVGIYLRLKGKGRPVTFQRSAERSCGYVIDVCSDKDITTYTKADANAFRGRLRLLEHALFDHADVEVGRGHGTLPDQFTPDTEPSLSLSAPRCLVARF
ncbi:DUF6538 domain-containing protein [Phaeovulum veldkampii]|uniref:DUF6538 domain-containing protein n=1 Tax=Phaeovulum veldkampii TaxID=33049 RepID=UPI0010E1EDA1|nr:hypothetical protein EV658_11952 [Phaeovulum veldkampii DSM 11550]